MDSDFDNRSSEVLLMKFNSILDQMKKDESPPSFIVAENERFSPNSHFSVPIDGEFGRLEDDSKQSKASLPQQHQTQPPKAIGQSKNQSPQSTQTGTMVQLPAKVIKDTSMDVAGYVVCVVMISCKSFVLNARLLIHSVFSTHKKKFWSVESYSRLVVHASSKPMPTW